MFTLLALSKDICILLFCLMMLKVLSKFLFFYFEFFYKRVALIFCTQPSWLSCGRFIFKTRFSFDGGVFRTNFRSLQWLYIANVWFKEASQFSYFKWRAVTVKKIDLWCGPGETRGTHSGGESQNDFWPRLNIIRQKRKFLVRSASLPSYESDTGPSFFSSFWQPLG